jgi:hypothetical protein
MHMMAMSVTPNRLPTTMPVVTPPESFEPFLWLVLIAVVDVGSPMMDVLIPDLVFTGARVEFEVVKIVVSITNAESIWKVWFFKPVTAVADLR